MKEYVVYEGESYTIEWYYNENEKSQALDFFNDLTEKRQDRFLFLIKRMGDFGRISDITKFRNEGDGIFAFKPKPDRFLCFFRTGKKIIITNAFTKKQDKMPAAEKRMALSCKKDYLVRIKKGTYYE